MEIEKIREYVVQAISKRKPLMKAPYQTAFRLLNGFLEGVPSLVAEVYGKTLVLHYYPKGEEEDDDTLATEVINIIREKCPWLETGVIKNRKSRKNKEKSGHVIFGNKEDKKIQENGIWYALDLTMNQDSSFYLDTRNLRKWVNENLTGKSVLNTFAYTGSIGIAALMGGASDVMHLDLNERFLTLAKRSALLNGKEVEKSKYQIGDFFSRINQYKKNGKLFDCVILDPPVFSKTHKGTIDIAQNYESIINKVRPLINNDGYLITINNGLFQTGKDHHDRLTAMCSEYLSIQEIIDIPADCIGNSENLAETLPADPSPYNHATKITILRIKRK
jgi:23S rRNA (cytosine1962-C5)-methyltransferase